MLNFTIGPVMSFPGTLIIGSMQTPYFRNEEFSNIMLENERMMLKYLSAPSGSRCVFLTASGTAAMESAVCNLLNGRDKVAVINGGTFGQRFADLCKAYHIPSVEVICEFGKQITEKQLEELNKENITALLVNMDETSSGVLYDMNLISDYCKKREILLIVDSISAFISDELDMKGLGADVVINSSQKALALQPGVSMIAMDERALERLEKSDYQGLYLSLKEALKNMDRGQTPFTPAVNILLQINERFRSMEKNGGIEAERERICRTAESFRKRVEEYPFRFVVDDAGDRSNTVTALISVNERAKDICGILKNDYGIWLCPNGGKKSDTVFRVGHIGNITPKDLDTLFEAFDALKERNLL